MRVIDSCCHGFQPTLSAPNQTLKARVETINIFSQSGISFYSSSFKNLMVSISFIKQSLVKVSDKRSLLKYQDSLFFADLIEKDLNRSNNKGRFI